MKKISLFLLSAVLVLSLSACGKDEQRADAPSTLSTGQSGTQQQTANAGITLLCDGSSSFSNHFGTESGFYYFTQNDKIADGLFGMHLMYIDYATKKEVYLCSDSGCRHDSDKCSSVYAQGEFGIDSLPFVWGDSLYVLNRGYDNDGGVSYALGGDPSSPEAQADTLYRMALDGSSREKIYTFPDNITTEKLVFGDGEYLWFVTKRLETEYDAVGNYTASTDRNLSKYSIERNEIVDTISLEFGDNIYQTVIGAAGNSFILNGVAYPDGMSEKETAKLADEEWKEIYKNSSTVYAALDCENKSKTEIYRADNKAQQSACTVRDGYLYISGGEGIIKIDVFTGEKTPLAALAQTYIYFTLSDTLCCTSLGENPDPTLYFVDMKSGETYHSTLTNRSLGWQLDILADAGENVLAVYDYDVSEKSSDGAYEIYQYRYALISKDDLYASRAAGWMPVEMAGSGK
ncbi:MAG: hypothetical protein Q4G07_02600 [Oscillospiraceae bacterium]|nr:hypothetical protein [Oscillospiraceae bacterium]